MSNPLKYNEKEILLEQDVVVSRIFKDQFELSQNGKKIMVTGMVQGLSVNDYISIRAVFHKEGYLTIKEAQIMKLRRLKMFMSLCAAGFVGVLFLRRYRLCIRKVPIVERRACQI